MNKKIEITEQAEATINNMGNEVRRLRMQLGEDHPLTVKAATSLSLSLITMIGLGGHIGSDGEHSLICSNDFLTYGVNYLGTRNNEHGAGEWSVNS